MLKIRLRIQVIYLPLLNILDVHWQHFMSFGGCERMLNLRLVKRFYLTLIGVCLGVCSMSMAQTDYRLKIKKAESKITVDGILNEEVWQQAEVAGEFYQQFPFDTAFALSRTEVRVAYDDLHLHISAVCFDELPGPYVVQSLKRDFSYPVTDAFGVYIDPFCDKTNGFNFTVSPLGVQREGLLENGGSFGVSTQWDNKWFSAVHRGEGKWTVEMAIPFKTLRFPAGQTEWRINFSRNDLKRNENSTWVPMPRQFNTATLAFTGVLEWDSPPPSPGRNVSLIPYALGNYTADYERETTQGKPNAGLDAKVAVTPGLNLDLTVNPDFSQVEVDRQVTNLSRFSLFFPERRQFFIENSDLFSNFGFSKIRPFFSRQIGLYNGEAIPILAGARLSGKLNRDWRIGFMDMQTEGVAELGLRPQNYAVAAVQRQVFSRSNIAAIFVNRQGFAGNVPDAADYNRIVGLDFNFASDDNKWRSKAFYHRSFDPGGDKLKSANAVWIRRSTPVMDLDYNHEWVDANYNAETGFVPRGGHFRFEPGFKYNFYPKKKGAILRHGPSALMSWYWDNRTWQSIERQTRVGYSASFRTRAELSANVEDWYVYLLAPFDPSRTGQTPLPDSSGYQWRQVEITYTSDFRKPFYFTTTLTGGGFYAGNKITASGEIIFRRQPWGIFSLALEQNRIALSDTVVNLTLLSPRVEVSFTRSLFFTTFFQFNTQTRNFNINARLQWRFAPMSDLFIVLTDNYLTQNFAVRNRAIVLKLNYWLTL